MIEKYSIPEESLSERDTPILLQCIANELAERNRLKKLELMKTWTVEMIEGEEN
ncbi:uncharacterized protein METZ01_LOCUS391968 [marine metagenome]|uniref:Uncharacterized protein n=1 Tax=marine metagenome TaxID=408172 RepID=A0A382UY00_9ZZZZ|tara:strand:- start:615 stop:776 length:162 start_codon:yes stop_codon:yes gene_type:complete